MIRSSAILPVISALLAGVASLFRSRCSLALHVLALQHQVAVYQQTVHRPRLRPTDRLFWAWLSRVWQDGKTLCRPATHGDRLAQEAIPRLLAASEPERSAGPARDSQGVRVLIRDMSRANPTWGAPRIIGELRKLGIHVAKSTVEKYRVRHRQPPSPTWRAFLHNHMKDLVALDFFTVPTVTCKVLFVLVILAHER